MLPPEASNSTVIGPKKCNLDEAQDKDFNYNLDYVQGP